MTYVNTEHSWMTDDEFVRFADSAPLTEVLRREMVQRLERALNYIDSLEEDAGTTDAEIATALGPAWEMCE